MGHGRPVGLQSLRLGDAQEMGNTRLENSGELQGLRVVDSQETGGNDSQ